MNELKQQPENEKSLFELMGDMCQLINKFYEDSERFIEKRKAQKDGNFWGFNETTKVN